MTTLFRSQICLKCIGARWRGQEQPGRWAAIEPWDEGKDCSKRGSFHFASMQAGWIREFMGGNFTVRSRCSSILLYLAYLVGLAKLGSVFETPAAGHRNTT